MSISRRSLLIVLLACGVVFIAWMGSGAEDGPSPASANALSPFPPAQVAALPPVLESVPSGETPVGEEAGSGSFAPTIATLMKSRLGGEWQGDGVLTLSDGQHVFGKQVLQLSRVPRWMADVDGDGELNESDIAAFQELWDWSDPGADFNGDGVVDPFDYADFVVAYDQRNQRPESAITLMADGELRSRIRHGENVAGQAVTVEFRVELMNQPR